MPAASVYRHVGDEKDVGGPGGEIKNYIKLKNTLTPPLWDLGHFGPNMGFVFYS